ncbi:MAG: OmpA family protein [Treponema sp.]|nr:OmpA family protein [Treponema sp.]
MRHLTKTFLLTLTFFTSIPLFAGQVDHSQKSLDQRDPDQNVLEYRGASNYEFVERTDLRRYDEGKYIGLVSREVRSFIVKEESTDGAFLYDGNFFVEEATRRQNAIVGDGISDSIPSKFKINSNGEIVMLEDNGFPSFRGFPSYTKKELQIGDTWQAKAVRAVDPLNKGIVTKMPIYVEYTYKGEQLYAGQEVYLLTARWATRYGARFALDFDGDKDLVEATGSHSATIYVSKETGEALVVRDSVNETFIYKSSGKITFKGTISLFTKYPPATDTQEFLKAVYAVAENYGEEARPVYIGSKENPVAMVEKTNAGIRLTLPDLQFKANEAVLLNGESERLDQIARLLEKVPDVKLLVEGHTADVGNPAEEKQLSLDRAHTIAGELAKRGIKKERFICKGSGSAKPIASNDTPENKAKNRRVEITILN